MKRYITIVLTAIALASMAHAGPNTIITNYFTGYIGTDTSFVDAGDTGLTTGKVYACFCMDDFSDVTAAELSHTNSLSDVREILYAIDGVFYTAVQELTLTNRPVQYTVKKSAGTSGTTNIIVKIKYSKTTNVGLSDNDIKDE